MRIAARPARARRHRSRRGGSPRRGAVRPGGLRRPGGRRAARARCGTDRHPRGGARCTPAGKARARLPRRDRSGEPLLELGAAAGPEILVSLPPPGRSENDRRYPIALLGARGLLTSDSTRIDGLVSITDVAAGRLRVVPNDDPVEALRTLDHRIERNDRWRLPLTIALAALLIVLALVRPQFALRALLVALAANLWLEPRARARRGSRRACAAARACLHRDPRRLSRLDGARRRDGRALALRPVAVGPVLRNQQPARDDAARAVARRRGSARPRGDRRRRAGVRDDRRQSLRRRRRRDRRARRRLPRAAAAPAGHRPTLRLAAAVAAGAIALALLLLGLDAATGGSSHVTDAVGDGPVALARDIADRVELSVRRTAASVGATAVVLGSLAILVARRAPRPARTRARCVPRRPGGLAPRQRHARRRARDGRRDRDRTCPLPARARPVKLALDAPRRHLARAADRPAGRRRRLWRRRGSLADCPRPSRAPSRRRRRGRDDDGRGPTTSLEGDAANGEKVFASAGCGGCHTLKAAGSSGNVGPNLDDAKPDVALVVDRVTNGSGRDAVVQGPAQRAGNRRRRSVRGRVDRLNLPPGFPRDVAAIACDLDRTLIAKDGVLRPRTIAAIGAARAAGIHVLIATGRMFRSALPYAQAAGIEDPLVCYQGAAVVEPATRRVPAARADPARARARGDRSRAGRGLRPQLLRRRRSLRRQA